MRVCLARLWGHRHADQRIAARQLLDDLMAQIVPRAHQPVALRTRSLPVQQERGREVRSVEQGHGVILAAQLRCQAQFAAVHGAELGIKHFVAVCVHQASGADLRPGREAMLVAAAAQFDSILRGVRRRPDHTIHSQHAQWLAHIHRRTAPGLGQ